jgi:hypothetical protein
MVKVSLKKGLEYILIAGISFLNYNCGTNIPDKLIKGKVAFEHFKIIRYIFPLHNHPNYVFFVETGKSTKKFMVKGPDAYVADGIVNEGDSVEVNLIAGEYEIIENGNCYWIRHSSIKKVN